MNTVLYGDTDDGYVFNIDFNEDINLDIPAIDKALRPFNCYLAKIVIWPGDWGSGLRLLVNYRDCRACSELDDILFREGLIVRKKDDRR